MKPANARLHVLALVTLTVMSGCGTTVFEADRIDYKSAGKAPPLDIPPDLTKISTEGRYVTPGGGAVSASGYQQQSTQAIPTAASSLADARIERLGNQRWLVVSRPPEQLWEPIKSFWTDSGFLLLQEERNLGLMETDWAENRAKLPQDIIRNSIGKVLDALYSTSERDKFRTRLERTANGGTEIYISHRGMQEIATGSKSNEQIVWTPRPSDPELETEFLKRLMVRLGASSEQAKAIAAAGGTPQKSTARVASVGGSPVVVIDDDFDRAWRRVGLSLDRTGFTVEDRDRSQGLYYVRYVEQAAQEKDTGFFSRWFSGSPKAKGPSKYRISVKSVAQTTTVSILTEAGQPDTSPVAAQIVQMLASDIK
jgi:outer membrane protein assembly factor BamC